MQKYEHILDGCKVIAWRRAEWVGGKGVKILSVGQSNFVHG